jgi:sec-independent protein translocase protein TatB
VIDLSIGKLLVIGVVALFFISPEKLPLYAAQLGRWVRVARSLTDEAKQRVAAEMGPGFEDVDWATLDPRRYSPKRLLAEAWNAPSAVPGTGPVDDRGDDREPDLLALADARATERPEPGTPGRPFDLAAPAEAPHRAA